MDKTESAAADISRGTVPRQRFNLRMRQNVLLILLDNNVDTNDLDCCDKITELRCVVNSINTFTDHDQCVDFLTNTSSENVYMIISGTLCQNIVPQIHDVAQLHTIFIFCENKTVYEKWAEAWSKIRGVFTEISSICQAIRQTARQCEENAISISFMTTSDDISQKTLDQLDPSFMYTQILKEVVLTINCQQQDITGFIDYLREHFVENDHDSRKIKQFQDTYQDQTPICWYTREYFLYSMLNCALRLMDVNVIIKMAFFIGDLHRHIEKLHSEQFGGDNSGNKLTVYRGQSMHKADFEKMAKIKGGLLSSNNFLSTSKNQNVFFQFADGNQTNPDLVTIRFVMIIDPTKSTTPFASISHISHYKDEDEVLFAMHSVFRIREITSMDENNRLFQVDLTLTDHIRKDTLSKDKGWERLGSLLMTMNKSDEAQQVYEILLDQTTVESQKALFYNQIGWAKRQQGEFRVALTFFEKSLEIYKNACSPNHPDVAWPTTILV